MTTIDLKLSLQLKEDEYFKVGDHIFTNNEKLDALEEKLHFCGDACIRAFKEYESLLTMEIMEKWTKLIKALNQTTSCCAVWDYPKIIKELVDQKEHPVSWYVENCKIC